MRLVGSSNDFEKTLAALVKMGGAHPAELGSIALTTWTHPREADVVLKCKAEVLDKLMGR